MPTWAVELIIGVVSAVAGVFAGYTIKTLQIKKTQKIKGNNNIQIMGGDSNNGNETKTKH